MKNNKKILFILLCFICLFSRWSLNVQAAEGSISFGSGSYSVNAGESFPVGVHIKGSEAIGVFQFYLTYDANILEYVSGADGGGNGSLSFMRSGDASSYSYMLTFRAKTSGTSSLSIGSAGLYPLNPASGDTMTITAAGSVSVHVGGQDSPSEAQTTQSHEAITTPNQETKPTTSQTVASGGSDECRLESMSISPTGLWGFSPDITEYDITVENELTDVTITATPMGAGATYKVSDTSLKVGVNTVTVTVTSASGATKSYNIIIRRKEGVATEETTDSLEEDPSGGNQDQDNDDINHDNNPDSVNNQDNIDNQDNNIDNTNNISNINPAGLSFQVNGVTLYLSAIIDKSVPAGYEPCVITYMGENISAYRDPVQGITLLYLVDEQGMNGNFYVYDAMSNMIYAYIHLTNADGSYVLLSVDDSVESPLGYKRALVTLSSGAEGAAFSVTAWVNENNTDFILVYAMNNKGETSFYQYDKVEKTFQRYNVADGTALSSAGSITDQEILRIQEENDQLRISKEEDSRGKLLIIIILAALSAVLLLVVIVMIIKSRGQDLESELYQDFSENRIAEPVLHKAATETAAGEQGSLKSFAKPLSALKVSSAEKAQERLHVDMGKTSELLDLDDEDFTFYDDDGL